MTISVSIPVTVTREAEARIAELGLHAQVELMLDHARHHLPEVERIAVVLNERWDLGGDPGVTVEVHGTRPFDPADSTSRNLIDWEVDTFPPEVLEHLHTSYVRGGAHAG